MSGSLNAALAFGCRCHSSEHCCHRYHDGYLSIHFEANKYQDIDLSPLQEEALWCAARPAYALL